MYAPKNTNTIIYIRRNEMSMRNCEMKRAKTTGPETGNARWKAGFFLLRPAER